MTYLFRIEHVRFQFSALERVRNGKNAAYSDASDCSIQYTQHKKVNRFIAGVNAIFASL